MPELGIPRGHVQLIQRYRQVRYNHHNFQSKANTGLSGSGLTLKSSKGSCGVSSSKFTSGSGVTATLFTASNGFLSYEGKTTFYASAVPSGSTQEAVYTTSKSVSVSFEWQSL